MCGRWPRVSSIDKPEPVPYAKGSWGPAEAAELAKPGTWYLGE